MKKQKGATLFELLIVIGAFLSIATAGAIVYVVGHFLAKFW